MARTASRTVVQGLAILVALAASCAAGGTPPKPRGQQVHLFEATVGFLVDGVADDEYNYFLLAAVLGSVEAARSAMFETYPGMFRAFLTNNQAQRLSKVQGVLKVRQRDDLVPTDGQ